MAKPSESAPNVQTLGQIRPARCVRQADGTSQSAPMHTFSVFTSRCITPRSCRPSRARAQQAV
eukprot:6178161-Pleurochrysis_carterae.AAC.3